MITANEADLYCRMTLKQYGLGDYRITWKEYKSATLGRANPWDKEIELSPKILSNFQLLKLVCLHELAHVLDWIENGGTFVRENGRNDFHGKNFKAICKRLGIPSHTKIPENYL